MAHVFHVWWLHGLTYKPMDAVLFLDIRSLVFSIHGKIRCASSCMPAVLISSFVCFTISHSTSACKLLTCLMVIQR